MKIINITILCVTALCVVMTSWGKLQAQDIHLITVGEMRLFPDDKARQGIKQDCLNVANFFKEMVPETNLKIHEIDGMKVTAKGILDLIQSVQCVPQDTLIFYYSGHAANDELFGGQYFQLRNLENNADDPLPRKLVREEMEKKNAHLVVMMTDCCNIFYPIEFSPDKSLPTKNIDGPYSPVIKQMFIAPSGVADITSSRIGQYSMVSKDGSGSIGTVAWLEIFRRFNKELLDGTRKNIQWREVMISCAQRTDGIFKQSFPNGVQGQKSQDMHIYQMPEKPRFGVRAMSMEMEAGVKVTELIQGAPGDQAGIKEKDIIVKIDGKVIQDEVEYSKAIDAAQDKMEVVIRRKDKDDKNNEDSGKELTLNIVLNEYTMPTPAPATPAPATPAPATPAPATPTPATATPATPAPATATPATPATKSDPVETVSPNSATAVEIKTLGITLIGATISAIDPQGLGAINRINIGDKIISIDKKTIQSPQDCIEAINTDKKFVEAIIQRSTDGQSVRITLQLK